VRKATIGIDLGGTKILFVLFDDRFRVLAEIKLKTKPERGEERFRRVLGRSAKALMREAKKRGLKVVGLGAGCPGVVDEERGLLREAPNIPFVKDFPFRRVLQKAVGLKAVLENDVRAGLFGEHQLGAARGRRNALGIFLGTGIGGAVLLDGKLYRGATGTAGDIGRTIVDATGPLSGSVRHGTLDDLVGRHAIAGDAAALAIKQWAPRLYKKAGADLAAVRASTIADAIRAGDKELEKLMRGRARLLGIALSNFVSFLCPDIIVLGGGTVEAMPALFEREVSRALKEFAAAPAARHARVKRAALGDDAVAAGAAELAWDRGKM